MTNFELAKQELELLVKAWPVECWLISLDRGDSEPNVQLTVLKNFIKQAPGEQFGQYATLLKAIEHDLEPEASEIDPRWFERLRQMVETPSDEIFLKWCDVSGNDPLTFIIETQKDQDFDCYATIACGAVEHLMHLAKK